MGMTKEEWRKRKFDKVWKVCSKCDKRKKKKTGFNKTKRTLEGVRGECKECQYKAEAEGRKRNWKTRSKYAEKYFQENRQKCYDDSKKVQARFPEKMKARRKVQYAVRKGTLVPGTHCKDCGKKGGMVGTRKKMRELLADHYLGYEPEHHLHVEWVCRRCSKFRDVQRAKDQLLTELPRV